MMWIRLYLRLRRSRANIWTLICVVLLNMFVILGWDMYSMETHQDPSGLEAYKKTYMLGGEKQRMKINGRNMYSQNHLYHKSFKQYFGLWPKFGYDSNDRIIEQLKYKPKVNATLKPKLVVFYFGLDSYSVRDSRFSSDLCQVSSCDFTGDKTFLSEADAVVFQDAVPPPRFLSSYKRPSRQIWIWFALESPVHTVPLNDLKYHINWTATYHPSSTIVTPYDKFVLHESNNTSSKIHFNTYQSFHTKPRKVVTFVSNCAAQNHRLTVSFINIDLQ